MTERFKCSCCGETKYSLENRKSKVTGMAIFICRTCISKGYEPRHILIIGYQSGGEIRNKAIKFIENRLYFGETIALTEVLGIAK